MSTRAAISVNTYKNLVRLINRKIAESRRIVEQQTVTIYWNVGRSMQEFLQHNDGRGADAALARRLSRDLNIHERTLQQSLQFYRAYPKLDNSLPLSWSHYRVLMTIGEPDKRRMWERRSVRGNIGTNELRSLLRASRQGKPAKMAGQIPAPGRGILYHYRLVKVDYVNEAKDGIMLDCGFDNRIVPPSCRGTPVNKRVVRAVRNGDQYTMVISNTPIERIFTYKAFVERVVDGDTLLANIDCGFGIWTRQYLRLKWIDAPEIRDAGGLHAKNWVEKQLSNCPFIIAKTSKSDQFDRYLADVFYLPGKTDPQAVAENGIYLNQRLIDKGLAWVWEKK